VGSSKGRSHYRREEKGEEVKKKRGRIDQRARLFDHLRVERKRKESRWE